VAVHQGADFLHALVDLFEETDIEVGKKYHWAKRTGSGLNIMTGGGIIPSVTLASARGG
jgi:hypothetical protein